MNRTPHIAVVGATGAVGVESAGERRSDAARGSSDDDMTVTQLHGWIVRSDSPGNERMVRARWLFSGYGHL